MESWCRLLLPPITSTSSGWPVRGTFIIISNDGYIIIVNIIVRHQRYVMYSSEHRCGYQDETQPVWMFVAVDPDNVARKC